jgi:molybdopterin molybdotransferase
MISVDEAVARIVAAFTPLESERVPLSQACGRVLARDAVAALDQPPYPVSAMDGYAVRLEDTNAATARLRVIGAAPAGHPFDGNVGPAEAVRIFTGSVVPNGADAIVIQEDVEAQGETITLKAPATPRHIRHAGLDFRSGEVLAKAGHRLGARDLALLAAGDIATVEVRRKPRVAFAATGDELSRPGEPRKPGGIVASSGYGLSALIGRWGGEAIDLGILADTIEAFSALPANAARADLIITMGGASVGDHDLVQRALAPRGFVLDFWKIAMRPGKPLIFGRLGTTPFFGLPGNPVSTFVCAILFVRPALAAMLGEEPRALLRSARLATPLHANDTRQDYLRARISVRDGELWAEPFATQDSSMMSVFAQADGLILRPPHAPQSQSGDRVDVLLLDDD